MPSSSMCRVRAAYSFADGNAHAACLCRQERPALYRHWPPPGRARRFIAKEALSMQAIRAWMAQDPTGARALMWENKSFVFFREVDGRDPDLGPPGAQMVPLTPARSLAVDRALWMFGTPVWLDTQTPAERPAEDRTISPSADRPGYRHGHQGRGRAAMSIWGAGDQAAAPAGHMKSPGRMIVLLPKALARKLLTQ